MIRICTYDICVSYSVLMLNVGTLEYKCDILRCTTDLPWNLYYYILNYVIENLPPV